MTIKNPQQAEAIETLKEWGVKKNTLIHAQVTKVAPSGMSRNIKLYFIRDNELTDITYHVAIILGHKYTDGFDGGMRVSGCGMDMLFDAVYRLSPAMGYGEMNQRTHEPRKKGLRYRPF
jgi:hypothetical protein